jgi:hypothetical protein
MDAKPMHKEASVAQQTWTLKGRIRLEPQIAELRDTFGTEVGLQGVTVKVEAKEFSWDPTGWQDWGETVTQADGSFTVVKEKDKSKRYFRVRVLFKDNDLKIYPENNGLLSQVIQAATLLFPGGPVTNLLAVGAEEVLELALEQFTRLAYDVPWYTVREDADKRDGPVVDFGDLPFGSGNSADRGDFYARRHAELWYLTKKVIGVMNDQGPGLGFIDPDPLAIKYPHDNPWVGDNVEVAYSSPENYVVFLVKNSQYDSFEINTIIHEIMHQYVYQHSKHEKGLAWQLIIHGTTHGSRQDKTWVAAHEALAEFLKGEVYRRLFPGRATIGGGTFVQKRLPYSRKYLRDNGTATLADVDHTEDGWTSLFNLLVCTRLCELDMNTTEDYAEPGNWGGMCDQPVLSFADFLRIFLPTSAPFNDVLDRSELTKDQFLSRAVAALSQLETKHKDAYLQLLDPRATVQPSDVFPRQMVAGQLGGTISTSLHPPVTVTS